MSTRHGPMSKRSSVTGNTANYGNGANGSSLLRKYPSDDKGARTGSHGHGHTSQDIEEESTSHHTQTKDGSVPGLPNVTGSTSNATGASTAPAGHEGPFKPCHCKKSKCLKLYCECFARRGYCVGCSCVCCQNIPKFEEVRKKAIQATLERDPHAFYRGTVGASGQGEDEPLRDVVITQTGTIGTGPGIQSAIAPPSKHRKGCNCKKSGCLKKYCECYQAGLPCGPHCKCSDCRNGPSDHDHDHAGEEDSSTVGLPDKSQEASDNDGTLHRSTNGETMGRRSRRRMQEESEVSEASSESDHEDQNDNENDENPRRVSLSSSGRGSVSSGITTRHGTTITTRRSSALSELLTSRPHNTPDGKIMNRTDREAIIVTSSSHPPMSATNGLINTRNATMSTSITDTSSTETPLRPSARQHRFARGDGDHVTVPPSGSFHDRLPTTDQSAYTSHPLIMTPDSGEAIPPLHDDLRSHAPKQIGRNGGGPLKHDTHDRTLSTVARDGISHAAPNLSLALPRTLAPTHSGTNNAVALKSPPRPRSALRGKLYTDLSSPATCDGIPQTGYVASGHLTRSAVPSLLADSPLPAPQSSLPDILPHVGRGGKGPLLPQDHGDASTNHLALSAQSAIFLGSSKPLMTDSKPSLHTGMLTSSSSSSSFGQITTETENDGTMDSDVTTTRTRRSTRTSNDLLASPTPPACAGGGGTTTKNEVTGGLRSASNTHPSTSTSTFGGGYPIKTRKRKAIDDEEKSDIEGDASPIPSTGDSEGEGPVKKLSRTLAASDVSARHTRSRTAAVI